MEPLCKEYAMKLISVFMLLLAVTTADACFGQRSARRASRRSVETSRSVTTIRMNAPAMRVSSCANGQCTVR